MAFEPTDMQKKAINTDGAVLVAAAAGSGKTAVLTERVIRKLTDAENPVSADRLLIVTFTNAAAGEMRSRIEKRLFEECDKNPDNTALLKQKHLLSSAKICTIDSFCIDLVRENFEKCGVSPDFSVDDGSALRDINAQVMADTVSECFEEGSGEFKLLLELTGCEYDEKSLTDIIEQIYLYSCQLPNAAEFLSSLKAPYENGFSKENALYEMAFEMADEHLENAVSHSEEMLKLSQYVSKNEDKHYSYSSDISLMLDQLKAESEKKAWDGFKNLLGTANIPRVPSGDKEDVPTQQFREHKDKIKKLLDKIRNIFFMSQDEIAAQHKRLSGAVELLCDMIEKYGERLFEEYKKENILTFYNTEQLALELLRSEGSGGLSDRYDEVLVDEFQDVNDLQNTLFRVLSGEESRLFAVGDVKQSIYGFRGSNPQNFLEKKNRYTEISKANEDEPKKIILADNFRSRSGVCDYVNYFFRLFMNGQTGSLVYNDEERLNAGAKFPELDIPAAELIILEPAEESEASLLECEASSIAEYIESVMNEGEIIRGKDGALRRAEYSDFAILLNTMRIKADVISAQLMKCGIPVSYSPDGFVDTVEISVMLSLLKIIDNPASDVELLTVMMSPIFGFSAEDMAEIRASFKSGSLYSAVIAAAGENRKCEEFLNRLSEYRRYSAVLPINSLISKLLSATDFLNIVSAMSHGEVRRGNLLTLASLATQYVGISSGSISGFIRHINSLSEKGIKSTASAQNGVKIMSMHKSKGLQFPICIIGNISSRLNNADSISPILYKENIGIGFKYYNEQNEATEDTLAHKIIAARARVNNIDERLRLLYVAMTRAEDRLVFVSSSKDMAAQLNSLAYKISDEAPRITAEWLKETNSMGQWILTAALLHPDADMLRRLCDVGVKPEPDLSRLKVRFLRGNKALENRENANKAFSAQNNDGLEAALEAALQYGYEFSSLKEIQAKSSVSAIANKAENDRFAYTAKPSFMHNEGLSPAARGTAMHSIMQFIEFRENVDVEAEIERLKEWQFITETQAAAADIKALKAFFESALYSRIMKASLVKREMRFLTEMPAFRLDNTLPEQTADEEIIVQGAVDLCFEDENGLVVVDFKTDRVSEEAALISAYSEQLEIYSKACEKIFSKKVYEKIIYSFALSREIKL